MGFRQACLDGGKWEGGKREGLAAVRGAMALMPVSEPVPPPTSPTAQATFTSVLSARRPGRLLTF